MMLSKTDYAANGGSVVYTGQGGPDPTCITNYPNCATGFKDQSSFNGVSGERSEISQIPDGQSNVFFAGEKYIDPSYYYTGTAGAENNGALEGYSNEIDRWVASGPARDTKGQVPIPYLIFGSAHPAGCHFVFCDGHVSLLPFTIDLPTFSCLGVRNDGNPTSDNY
jgi:prepilin-type processing-associated H-X9-DG protein